MTIDEEVSGDARRSSLVTRRSLSRRRIYLMRHAEVSYFDEAGNPHQPRGVPLTPEGREQAAAAARVLAPVPLTDVPARSSTVPRTNVRRGPV